MSLNRLASQGEAAVAALQQALDRLARRLASGAAASPGTDDRRASGRGQGADAALLGEALAALVAAGVDRPPLPGGGATLVRWRMLAAVAATNVALAKLYEGHTDAVAILAELSGREPPTGTRWGVWAAESPRARVVVRRAVAVARAADDAQTGAGRETDGQAARNAGSRAHHDGAEVRLDGRKSWCSGAANLTHALLTAWGDDHQVVLVSVALDQPGVTITDEGWHARGMSGTASVDVVFDDALGVVVGAPGSYLSRPGFWHGGAGIAACWFGAAAAIGRYTLARFAERAAASQGAPGGDAAAVDAVSALYAAELDLALSAGAALLRETAAAIDDDPAADSPGSHAEEIDGMGDEAADETVDETVDETAKRAQRRAMRARLDIEALAERVLRVAGRALGASPLCRDAHFAALMTDLPVFLRQSHAERDLAAFGTGTIVSALHGDDMKDGRWTL